MANAKIFSSPFLGDFFSIGKKGHVIYLPSFFVPFLGDFFSIHDNPIANMGGLFRFFVPFLGDFFSISVPAKPQPVCSRKRICGGDGGIASSGTLLRR